MPEWRNNPWAIAPAAIVDIVTAANATWNDAFQFDPPALTGAPPPPYYPPGSATGPTWTFNGQNFRLDIKGYINETSALLSLNSQPGNSTLIVVDDPINRILHFNVPEAVISGITGATGATGAGLVPGEYIYDFIMYDDSTPPIRLPLMKGKFVLVAGITGG
jgi:hypothetical protein